MHFSKPVLGTPLNFEHPLNKDLALHLAMNEGHGDKVQDLSLNGNHGTLNNFAFPPTAASGWNPGQTGVGLNFDETDDFVNCGSFTVLPGFTISFLEFTFGGAGYFCSDSADYANLFIRRTTPTTVNARVGDMNWAGGDITLSNNVWHNHIFTHTAAGDYTWYIDGVDLGTTAGSNFVGLSSDFYVGNRAAADRTFSGSIDQPRIQSRAWSAKEVRDYAINPWQVYLDDGGM